MDASRPRLPARRLAAVFLIPALLAVGTEQDPQDRTAPFPRSGSYLGWEGCLDCHEDKAEELRAAPHAPILAADALPGCETCHGPGEAHALDIDNAPHLITHPPELTWAGQSAFCGRCHRPELDTHGDLAGLRASDKVCTDCHHVHGEHGDPPHPGTAFATRSRATAVAEPVGAARCTECHPLRDALLERSVHHGLAAGEDASGCETCHGEGSLHAGTQGLARLITRPDRAADGVATCRSCHEDVDPVAFHWKDGHDPLLSAGMTCTTCHEVHVPADPKRLPAGASGRVEVPGGRQDGSAPRAGPTNALCARCHEPALDVLHDTIHESLGGRDVPLARGCAACHEGALDHARNGGRAGLVQSLRGTSADVQRATCTSCHDSEETLVHVARGAHHRNDVGCLSCHSPAAPADRVTADAEKRCAECHPAVAARFRMPNRHPVPEGHMHCSSCHDPHDARHRLRDLELREERCVDCHREYRGPFVFEHQASRSDGCVVCHSPHGASNRRMLHQANTRQNCLQCHGDFPAFHDQTTGAVFTNCLNCHTEVHGSNHSRFLFR